MDSKAMEERFTKLIQEHFRNPRIMKDLCTKECIVHFSYGTDWNVDETIEHLSGLSDPPDCEIHDCFATGDKIALRFRALTKHESGGTLIKDENIIGRFKGDRIDEIWVAYD